MSVTKFLELCTVWYVCRKGQSFSPCHTKTGFKTLKPLFWKSCNTIFALLTCIDSEYSRFGCYVLKAFVGGILQFLN